MSNLKIISVLVYLDRKKTRSFVGKLTSEKTNEEIFFYFKYDPKYLKRKYAIPLGPDLPLSLKLFESTKLFPSFQDRIPSKENPAYSDYCKEAGISVREQNSIVLLSTIAKRGPSSFIFEPDFEKQFLASDLKKYRETLNLTIREFSSLFSISSSHLQKIESNKFPGRDILRLIEIYRKYPKVAIEQIKKNSKTLHTNKYNKILSILYEQIKEKIKIKSNELGQWSDNLREEEVEYTLSLIEKINNQTWSEFINSSNIKYSISSVKGYELLVKRINKKPEINELNRKHIPAIMKVDDNEIWIYGYNNIGEPQLKQLESQGFDLEFKDQPYKIQISMKPRPEIYFVLNGIYHNHFYKDKIINIKSSFFEIRFAYSILLAGLKAEYEYKTGRDEKSIDFKIFGSKTKNNFLVELTSLRDSKAIKKGTWKNESFFGFSSITSSFDNENSAEIKDLIKVQDAILEKANKFSTILNGTYHIIIVDMRGFLTGPADQIDFHYIVFGGEDLDDTNKRHSIDSQGNREVIKGLFEESCRNQIVREQIHAIGFILEKNYTGNEIRTQTKLLINPNLVNEDEIKFFDQLFESW